MPVALAAVPAELFVAVALLLLLYAVQTLLVKPITTLLEHVPLIGGTVAQAINDVVGTVIGWAQDWVKWGVDAIVQIVQVPIKAVGDFVAMVGSFSEYVVDAIGRVASVAAGAVGRVADALASLAGRVATLANQMATALANIATLFSRVAAIIATAIPTAIAAARSAILATVDHLLDALDSALRSLIAAARTYAAALVNTLSQAINATIAQLRQWVLAAVATAVLPLQGALGELGRAIDQALGAIRAQLGILNGLLPLLSIVPLVAAIPLTITQFWRTKNECVDPTCSLLGDLLGGLGPVGELLTGTVLIALVEESIRNPEGTAQEVAQWSDELRGLASGVTQVMAGRSI